MEINIKVDEKAVLKKVMAGMNEDEIADEIRSQALGILSDTIRPLIEKQIQVKSKNVYRELRETVIKEHAKEISSKINRASLKKLLDSSEFDCLMCEVLWKYVEQWLDNNELILNLKTPKGTKYYPNKK